MATPTVTTIVKQIKKLSPTEQQELRALLDSLLAPAAPITEEEFKRRLAAQGKITVPSPVARARAARRSFKPVPVRGKPVSATIMEDRR